MNTPIGYTIGNALETREALEILHGQGPNDLRELTYDLAAEMLRAAGVAKTKSQTLRRVELAVKDGAALQKMREIVDAQGGDSRVVDAPDQLAVARHRTTVTAKADVDPGAGIRLHVQLGDQIRSGDELATLYTSERARLRLGENRVSASFRIGKRRPPVRRRVIETIRR
jgi:thymidine phosphorylase